MRTWQTLSLALDMPLDGSEATKGKSSSWPGLSGSGDDWIVITGGIDFGYHLDSAARLYELKGVFVI